MQDLSFHSPFCSCFTDFEAHPLDLKADPVSEGVPLMTTGGNRDSGGGDAEEEEQEEEEEEEEENSGVPSSHPHVSLQGNPVPPFLSKTYDLVDDRTLDPIISWGSKGESFVVWDPVEFARIILPRNFKHNNFSSFVRQLNTYMGIAFCSLHWLLLCDILGFHKIDVDRWEFANEAFQKGERHLLKNIQRRKSPHTGLPTEAGKSGLQNEVERLRTERTAMMQEVVELQHQQRVTVHHMEAVNHRLQAAEQRQKQMLSFLAKLSQNPAFLARLKQKKEQGVIGSSRMKKFIKRQQHEPGQSESDLEGQIVKYRPDWRNLTLSSVVPDTNPVAIEQSPYYFLQDMVNRGMGVEGVPFQIDNVASDELAITDELEVTQGFIETPEQVGEGLLSLKSEDLNFKGMNVMSPQQEIDPEYFVSFLEDLGVEKSFPEFLSPWRERIVKQEDAWSMGFDTSAGMSSSTNMLWGNLDNYDVPEVGSTGGFSDIWDTGSVQAAGGSGINKWPIDENPVDESESHTGRPLDDKLKNIGP